MRLVFVLALHEYGVQYGCMTYAPEQMYTLAYQAIVFSGIGGLAE